MIVKTEFGNIFGGYNPDTWNHGITHYNKSSFFFSVGTKEIISHDITGWSTTGNRTYGPIFGFFIINSFRIGLMKKIELLFQDKYSC